MGYAVKLSSGGFTKITCTGWSVAGGYSSHNRSIPANKYGIFMYWAAGSNTSYITFGVNPTSGLKYMGQGSSQASASWAPSRGGLYFSPCVSTQQTLTITSNNQYCSVGVARVLLNLE